MIPPSSGPPGTIRVSALYEHILSMRTPWTFISGVWATRSVTRPTLRLSTDCE
jgi:hypothetical protein